MKLRTIVFAIAVMLALGAGVAAFLITRPAEIAPRTAANVNVDQVALAGWREGPDGPVLVTPTPEGGVEARQAGAQWYERIDSASAEAIESWPVLTNPPYAVTADETTSADGTRIAATVLMPSSPYAGVVIIHGSGDSDRRNVWYLDFADYLARHGVAVWFPDKRGTGASEGEWRDASFETLAQDAVASRAALIEALGGEGVAPPVGYLGVSQGGWIAPIAAQVKPAPFVVVLSASATSPSEQLDHEVRADLQNDVPDFLLPVALPIARGMPRWRHPAFWRANGDIDPIAEIAASATPTLVLLGDQDEYDNVPVARSVELYGAARASGAPIRLVIVEGGGHDLSPGEGVGPIDRAALANVAAFIAEHAAQP